MNTMQMNDGTIGMVSIIMPVYNTPKELLKSSVQSVISQTYQNLELLIIDDGSAEQTAADCDELAELDNRIRVVHIPNSGVSMARNIGIEYAEGELIAFIDSDDAMTVHAVEMMAVQIKNVDFVVCGCQHVSELQPHMQDQLHAAMDADNEKCIEYLCYMNPPFASIETNAVWGKLYRRKFIGDIRFEKEMISAEDFKFNFDYIMKCKEGKYLDCSAYQYRVQEESLSSRFCPGMMNTIGILEEMIRKAEDKPYCTPLKSRAVNIAFTILMLVPDKMSQEKQSIIHFINQYRKQVLNNPNTKRKVKLAIISSYFGYGMTKFLFTLNRR